MPSTTLLNTNLTLKVPFVFPKRIYVCPLTQASYVVNSILTSKAPFLCPKHITIYYSCYQVHGLDVPKLWMIMQ